MHIDKYGQYIGQGETAGLKIIQELYKNTKIHTQVKLKKLIHESEELSTRGEKETIDIVIFRSNTPPICLRFQDKRHITKRMCSIDTAQKNILEKNGCKVIDIWYYECPELWKDEVNSKSRGELIRCIPEELLPVNSIGTYHD